MLQVTCAKKPTESEIWKCDECGKVFASNQNLIMHKVCIFS